MLITLVAIGAAHALYLSVLVFIKKNKRWPDYTLAIYLTVLAAAFATTFVAAEYGMPELMILQLNISLLLAPLFFIYLHSLIQESSPRSIQDISTLRAVCAHMGILAIPFWHKHRK